MVKAALPTQRRKGDTLKTGRGDTERKEDKEALAERKTVNKPQANLSIRVKKESCHHDSGGSGAGIRQILSGKKSVYK